MLTHFRSGCRREFETRNAHRPSKSHHHRLRGLRPIFTFNNICGAARQLAGQTTSGNQRMGCRLIKPTGLCAQRSLLTQSRISGAKFETRQRNSRRTLPCQASMTLTMRAWPVARNIFDAPYVREANERTIGWISMTRMCARLEIRTGRLAHTRPVRARAVRAKCSLAGLTTHRPSISNIIATSFDRMET